MEKNDKIPRIRFKGFTEAWEQLTFENIYKSASEGGTPDTNNAAYYDGGKIPFVKIEDTENKYIESVGSYITEEGLKYSSAWLVPANSVIFTNGATIGNVAINRFPVATKQGILGIIPHNSTTTEFLYYLLSSSEFQKEVSRRQTTGTFATIILKNINLIPVILPKDINEQEKIASFLNKLDSLLTIHQRKCDKLKVIKKALLEKMFPTDGESTPKIRFKGFTEAWEQLTFEKIFNYERPDAYIVTNVKYDDSYPTPVLTANKGFILGYTNEVRTCNKTCIIFDEFTLDSKYVDFKFMVKSHALKILTAKIGINLLFAYERLNSTKFDIKGHACHYISVVQPTKTAIPSYHEQEKIGAFFKEIDSLLTLHQRKCEKLKIIKKSLLEKMFV